MPDALHLLKERARATNTRLDIIEKDYAIGYLLAGIVGSPLGERLALKGGTALSKCYYPGYRFSEDLDFSTYPSGPLTNPENDVETALEHTRALLSERGPFEVSAQSLRLHEPHPFGQVAFLVYFQFPHHRQPLCRLKVEITIDEPLLLSPVSQPLQHGYPETLDCRTPVYDLTEIAAEKMRALLQSRQRLHRRGWGASRVCRDYYDLWFILRQETLASRDLPDLVRRKCELRNVPFNAPQELLAEDLLQVARREWQAQLLPFLTAPLSHEQVLEEVAPLILSLWK
jgi:predicted nucleotidyltransferase component of viral defense system